MEHEGWLPCKEQPITGSYPEPDGTSTHPQTPLHEAVQHLNDARVTVTSVTWEDNTQMINKFSAFCGTRGVIA
jgi:hypothetical protein